MKGNLIEMLQRDFTNCIRHDIKGDKEQISTICNKIKQFYLGEKEVGPDTADAIVDVSISHQIFILKTLST